MTTFAFTDIEGSTVRWERNRAAMHDALRRHDAILRDAIEQQGGRVFKTMGDAFFSAFPQPEAAVAAILAAQRSLALEDFSAVDGLRVRAAIHTGTADERDNDYFGPAVNKVARLLAIGHGGQVLLTAETATLVEAALPEDLSLCELGAYRLKDFSEPQRVFALLAPGLRAEFPPLRSLGTLPGNLSIVDAAEFRSVPNFAGRDGELDAVGAALQRDGAVAMLQGLGGVGKSSVAREYGWRNRHNYSVLWWLNAQTEDGIVDGLLRLGSMFEQGLDKLADRRVAAQRVINSVLGGFDKPALLVFDNLEDEALMRSWLPRTGARALATSRDAAVSGDVSVIPLQIWSLDAATAYLQHASGRTDLRETEAHAIAETLGAFPLAMAHAAASLRNLQMVSPQRYLERITEHLKTPPRGSDYPRSVFATFSTAVAQAEQQAAGAASVLCLASLFGADAIPDELFRQPTDLCPHGMEPILCAYEALDLRSTLGDDLRLDEALGALDRLSLLTFAHGSRTYGMHRLVQLAAKDLVGANCAWQETAVNVANAAFPEVTFATWPQCERLLSHARTVLEALPHDTTLVAAASLAYRCSAYLRQRGEYVPAVSICVRALAISENAFGPDHADVARSLNNLALTYWNQGRYAEAEPLYARALAIWETTLGPEHPYIAHTLNNLAIVYQEQGRHEEGEPLQNRALAIREKTLGPDHPDVAASLNNLAVVYYDQGRYAEAERLHTRALAIKEKVLGSDHPDVAFTLNNLASVHHQQGRYAEAEPLHARAVAIQEKALGPDHPDLAQSLHDLANAYWSQQRYSEAEPLQTRALAIRERAFGLAHPEVAESLNGLALTYREQGRNQEAEPLLLRSLSIRETALGLDHPLTRSTREAIGALRSAE
ncbi:MAG TPA: FxSxx-COOH system tetratricopeptide repeat protein [Candidatus Cybelea sp.]|jgi:class 3 adenylate cyclase/tetratricopeptide (TPR) repeat protein|nr:FxSxx-COOH system tetratricopeptide repeat protein [Candidatus Cybelea sp.]